MGQSRHAGALPRDVGELIRHLIAFAKPPRAPALQHPLTQWGSRRDLRNSGNHSRSFLHRGESESSAAPSH